MAKKAPFIAVYTDFLKEEAVQVIADVCGYNLYEARGRIVSLWLWCRDGGLDHAPQDSEFYAVHEKVVRRFLGGAGVEAILGGGCDSLALGMRFRDGLILLRGTQKDVARLRELSRTRVAGGKARAGGERDEMGRFGTPPSDNSVSEPTVSQHDRRCDSTRTPPGLQLHPPDLQRPDPEDTDVPEFSGTDVGVEIPADAWVAADTLRTLVLKAQPTNAIRKAPWGPDQRKGRRKAWAHEFRLLLGRDGRTTRELGEVLRFLFNGQTGDAQFVVLSPATLREKWDRITTQMKRVKRGGAPGEPAATIQISPEAASRLTAQPARPFLGITVDDDDENGEDFA